jgi:hypothetical protein
METTSTHRYNIAAHAKSTLTFEGHIGHDLGHDEVDCVFGQMGKGCADIEVEDDVSMLDVDSDWGDR